MEQLVIWTRPDFLKKHKSFKKKYRVCTSKDLGVGNKLGETLYASDSRQDCVKFLKTYKEA